MESLSFREPKKITDLAEYAGDYIEFIRRTPENDACGALVDYAANFFRDVPVTDRQLDALILMFVDRTYRYAAALEIKDAAVTTYFSKVTRYVLDLAAARGARIFYILDNEIRSDRFELAIELMFRAGVFVVTPYTTNGTFMDFADVRHALNVELIAGRHVAYAERDASVNYLRLVVDFAQSTDRAVFLRNQAPTNPEVQHIVSQRAIDSTP
jgi:hypothetical protein